MHEEIEKGYEICASATKEAASTFYYAFHTLPPNKRRAIYAVYHFCRMCDDIVDDSGATEKKKLQLNHLRKQFFALNDTGTSEPSIIALKHTCALFEIPLEYFEQLLTGVGMDLENRRYERFEDLYQYCYKVASVVGLICIEIFGYQDKLAKQFAIDMGIAMQLTNILRDIKEDAEKGRIYIPASDMKTFGYTERDLLRHVNNQAFRNMMVFNVQRAKSYFDKSSSLFPLLNDDSRICSQALHMTYSKLLDKIERSKYDIFRKRISLSKIERIGLIVKLKLFKAKF